ncbi:hypothetical protein V2J09_008252 [Rumex salicifolius]
MAKGDDALRKKKNKAMNKKVQKESSVSTRVASIIASKKRRQTGKRRQCQGMCFSLPTPEDPYNDRQGKPEEENKRKKSVLKRDDKRKRSTLSNGENIDESGSKRLKVGDSEKGIQMAASSDNKKLKNLTKVKTNGEHFEEEGELVDNESDFEVSGVPSKFLILCLKSIQDALHVDGGMMAEDNVSLFANPWGVDFWKSSSAGKNIVETSGNCPSLQQIAWIVSTAADTIARKDKEGEFFANPFLLYLVPSQEHATKVRSVCKPLKSLGIHTVSLHPGALIDHQITGLKSCEPEFLVATPERLWELISLKAIDISGVSLLAVEGMDMFTESGCLDVVKKISLSISKHLRAVVFQGHSSIQKLNGIITVREPFCKLSPENSLRNKQGGNMQSTRRHTLKEGKR